MSQKDLGAGFIRNHQSSCKILNQILYNFHSKSVFRLSLLRREILQNGSQNSSKYCLILNQILYNFHSKSVYITGDEELHHVLELWKSSF